MMGQTSLKMRMRNSEKVWSEQSNGLGHVAVMQSKFILRKTRKI